MKFGFFEKFQSHTFTKVADGDSNWDFYSMQFEQSEPHIVSISKDGNGAGDSFFGNLNYFKRYLKQNPKSAILTKQGELLLN